jgi:hypothetical protein
MAILRIFIRTVRHFFPEMSAWVDCLPDTRYQPMVIYNQRFLCWWALLMFGLGFSSRRSADNDVRELESHVLENLNRSAGTDQQTLPVAKTVDHYIGHVGSSPFAQLPHCHLQRLIRTKALDHFRFKGNFIVPIDRTGYLSFSHHHCPQCLIHRRASRQVSYLPPVLEPKPVSSSGLALSLATEFIQNPPGHSPADYQQQKLDCELKAFGRQTRSLKSAFPQLRMCLCLDGLYACCQVFHIRKQNNWHFVVSFQEGRLPELWREFQALLKLQPQPKLTTILPDKTQRLYQWVELLPYSDSQKRTWQLGAILCQETALEGQKTTFAWLTDLPVSLQTVIGIAEQAGRL